MDRSPTGQRWIRVLLYLIPTALLLAGFAQHSAMLLNDDVAWLVTAAGRMLEGGGYSRDFFEVNMPLAIGLYTPVPLIRQATSLPLPESLAIYVLALTLQALYLSVRVTRDNPLLRNQGMPLPLWTGWLLLALVFIPAYDFGEKEHLIFILGLPFILMTANTKASLSVALRVYISALAAIGFFAKPHFAALPFLLLLIRDWNKGDLRSLVSVELTTLLSAALLNTLIVTIRYPDWFAVVGWASDLYGAYRAQGWPALFVDRWVRITGLGAVLLAPLLFSSRRFRSSAVALAPTLAYFLAAYLVQFKGWSYQFLPVAISLFLIAGLAIQAIPHIDNGSRYRSYLTIVLPLASGALPVYQIIGDARNIPTFSNMVQTGLPQALAVAPRGAYVYVMSTDLEPIFPTVALMDRKWASRFPDLWPLAGIIATSRHGESADHRQLTSRYASDLADAVSSDLDRFRPAVVVVDQTEPRYGLPLGYNLLSFFLQNPNFARAWSHYIAIGASRGYILYVRDSQVQPAAHPRGQ